MNVCPDNICWINEPFITKLNMVMHHYEPDCLPERLFCCLEGQGHSEGSYNQIWLFNMSFELPIPITTNLGLVAYHQKLDCLMKRLDCSVVVKVEVTGRVQNSSECSSGWYLLNCWTFCDQTWYGDASSWASVMQKYWFAVFKLKVMMRVHIIKYDCFYHIYWTADPFATRFNWMAHQPLSNIISQGKCNHHKFADG